MIKRFNDYGAFTDKDIEKIAKTISDKERTTLVEIAETEQQALLLKKELRVQGYNTRIEPFGEKFKVYSILPEKIEYKEAVNSGHFKKLAWGRYCFQRESSAGMFKYDFDDGTIWRVISGEDGKEYLVKEVSDNNDEDVIRVKVASNNDIIVDANNVKFVFKIIYDNVDDCLINDLLDSNVKGHIYSMLENNINKVIDNVTKDKLIRSSEYDNSLKGTIKVAIDNGHVKSKSQIAKLIEEHTNQYVYSIGLHQKLFN